MKGFYEEREKQREKEREKKKETEREREKERKKKKRGREREKERKKEQQEERTIMMSLFHCRTSPRVIRRKREAPKNAQNANFTQSRRQQPNSVHTLSKTHLYYSMQPCLRRIRRYIPLN